MPKDEPVYTAARLAADGTIYGATFVDPEHPAYTWRAVPVTEFKDDHASSLAAVSPSGLMDFLYQRFRYHPVSRKDLPGGRHGTPKFKNLADLITNPK